MKLKIFRRAQNDDFVGSPPWFQAFFELFNALSFSNQALQNQLKFIDNHKCERKTIKLTHSVEKEITTTLGLVDLIMVGKSPQLSMPLYWRTGGYGKVFVKAHFDGSPTEAQEITLFLFE